jgi:hypothetical protein
MFVLVAQRNGLIKLNLQKRMNHYIVMFIIMILSGSLSTMSVWADKISDIRFSVNDAYMILLMSGWMILFMGIYYNDKLPTIIGIVLVITIFFAIRNQLFVTERQYLQGMIPHHSMAVLMSRNLLQKGTRYKEFVQNIIDTQEKEINYMKSFKKLNNE